MCHRLCVSSLSLRWSAFWFWLWHASQKIDWLCSICLVSWELCGQLASFLFDLNDFWVLWWLRKLIRCQRMRLHPKCEDKPCASTEDFVHWHVMLMFLFCVLQSLICLNKARAFGFSLDEITHRLSNHVCLVFHPSLCRFRMLWAYGETFMGWEALFFGSSLICLFKTKLVDLYC